MCIRDRAGIEPWCETVRPVIKNLCRHADIVCWNLGDLYATGSQFIEPTSVYSVNMFLDNGYRPIWIRIWKKQGQNFGVGPYHLVSNKPVQQYEYISAFSNKGETEEYNDQEYVWLSAFAGHSYKFVKRLTKEERKKWGYAGIWEMTTVRANKEHPATVSYTHLDVYKRQSINRAAAQRYCQTSSPLLAPACRHTWRACLPDGALTKSCES